MYDPFQKHYARRFRDLALLALLGFIGWMTVIGIIHVIKFLAL